MVGTPMDRVLTIKMSEFRAQGICEYLERIKEARLRIAWRQKQVTVGESTWQTPSGVHTVMQHEYSSPR